jgi:transglutaminase-like putative cysteine protease
MTILNVRHTTVYRYRRPVRLGNHRLMLRPRDSHDLRLIRTNLNFSPGASVRWIHDVFGNSIAIASFAESAAELRIESKLQLETYVVERPRSETAPEAASYPFIYSSDDRIDLGRMLERHHPDPVWSKNPSDRLSRGLLMIITQEPAQSLAALDAPLLIEVTVPRK